MKLIVLCSLFLGLSSAHQYEVGKPKNLNSNCGWTTTENNKVIYPWMVSVIQLSDSYFLCAGTILTQYHILTVADCVQSYSPKKILVCVGSCGNQINKKVVQDILIKDGFSTSKYENDLAILRTKLEIEFSKNVGPACFPTKMILNNNNVDTSLIFLGWRSYEFQRLNFKIKKISICRPDFNFVKEDKHICAAPVSEQNKMGDAGGTFVMLDTDTKRYTLVGVLLRIAPQSANIKPSTATNFTVFIDWVKNQVAGTKNAYLCYKTK